MKDENAFSQEQRPVVYLVGIGMGGEDQLTGRAMDCLEAAQVITGADRMLESVRPYTEESACFPPTSPVRWCSGWEASNGRRRPWCFPATPDSTAARKQLLRHS